MQEHTTELLKKYLTRLPAGFWKQYRRNPSLTIFNKHEVIFREGEEAEAAFLLYHGKVWVVKKREDSREDSLEKHRYSVIEMIRPKEILGLPSVLSTMAYTTSAIAMSKVYSLRIGKETLLQCLMSHPCYQRSIAEKLSRKIAQYEKVLPRGY